ncbi:MAG: methyltransferase domain-containing protein [bacterium]
MIDHPRHEIALPPLEFMWGVGSSGETPEETIEGYLEVGTASRRDVERALGPDWDWTGRRLLDFGCGAGRMLRQVLDWAEVGEVHGCDLDRPMVEWARGHLCPPIAGVELNGFDPPLPYPDDHFDVVTAFSVFTHLGVNWSNWLLEVRRVLKPGGVLIASILDQACARRLCEVPYAEDEVGMSVWAYALPGIPYVNVLHSHWWLREHWGRAFDIVSIDSGDYAEGSRGAVEVPGQGLVVARANDRALEPADLERENPDEDRYIAARRHQQAMFQAEGERLKSDYHDSQIRLMLFEGAHADLLEATSDRSLSARLRRLLGRGA